MRLCILVLPTIGPRGLEHLLMLREPFTALLEPGVERLQRAGAPAPDATPAVVAIGVSQIVAGYARAGSVPDLGETVPAVVRLILTPFCPPEEIDALF